MGNAGIQISHWRGRQAMCLSALLIVEELNIDEKAGTGYIHRMDLSCAFFNLKDLKGRLRDETILYSRISNRRTSG